jgi:hypothetical protein
MNTKGALASASILALAIALFSGYAVPQPWHFNTHPGNPVLGKGAAGKMLKVPSVYPTIQAAIDAASNGDTVLVAEGRYYENIVVQSKSIVVASHYILDGDTGHISNTIIDGSRPVNTDLATVVTIASCKDTTTVLCGFTITGGFGTRMFLDGAYARVCGGVLVGGSSALIANNHITGNVINHTSIPDLYLEAANGGLGANPLGAPGTFLVVRGNLIAGNRVEGNHSGAGGMSVMSDRPNVSVNFIIEHNHIKDNTCVDLGDWKAMGGGLGICTAFPNPGVKVVRNNVITGNAALGYRSYGGGVYVAYTDTPSGTLDDDPGELFYNNLVCNNHAGYLGGGVSIWRYCGKTANLTSWGKYMPRPAFINNTIMNNTAGDGSGFHIMNQVPLLLNNVVWNQPQAATEWGEIYLGDIPEWTAWHQPNTYGGIELHYSDVRRGWGDTLGNINADPLFVDGTYRLSDSSPCIGAGVDSMQVASVDSMHIARVWHHAPSFCFYGRPRPDPTETRPDIGACENPRSIPLAGIVDPTSTAPSAFALEQNYPNPFNPSTTIKFELPKVSLVRLTVYDMLGREVAVIVNERRDAGVHEARFDGSGLSSAVYLYRLQVRPLDSAIGRDSKSGAGEFVQTLKLVLLH